MEELEDPDDKQYSVSQDLYRILRFVEELIEKALIKQQQEDPKNKIDMIKKIFVNPNGVFKRSDIENRFKQLLRRLNAYDEKYDVYEIAKSQILVKVFKTDAKFRDDQLWTKLLSERCTLAK
ncbi:UNKNOWN [Stylonychia lemnae]|uniref:Uncharacterized protein n=1 Tax=Stylonychia lemnae TaxID=5949 RepID=A0A078A7K3_STYLE|nr:UNKNOWN [Stylonychia lemnae]|eukprot:CDW78235.1 UNKNOWN [Stylonychia lemnae]